MGENNPADEYLTTEDAAKVLKRSKRRILQMIYTGNLEAEKPGRDWLIRRSDLARANLRPPGRPPKE